MTRGARGATVTAMSTSTLPDYAAVTRAQQAMWDSGDYGRIAALIPLTSEQLLDAADLPAGSRVIDVAAGTGSTTLAAARSRCEVVGVDYVPALLERGRERAAAERLPAEFVVADAQDLPFEDASFDHAVSCFGVMFAADHGRAAREMARVTRPGGTIALANWTPEGFIGGLLRTVSRHVPPPAGVQSPVLWGSEDHVEAIFGDTLAEVRYARRIYRFRFENAAVFARFFVDHYGPTYTAARKLDGDGRAALEADLAGLAAEWDTRRGGPVSIPAEWLEVVAVRA